MTRVHQQVEAVLGASAGGERAGSVARDWYALAKPGIVKMVVVTAGVGFALAAMTRVWAGPELLTTAMLCLLGTALSAAGANALNMAVEARRDAAMHRTMRRPIAAGRMTVAHGLWAGAGCAAAGVAVLWLGTNPVAALVSAVTVLSYVLVYTPMKPMTPLATLVGAVPGALPPLIGWASASDGWWRGMNEPGGWALFALMFVWQVPHFLAIAWKYREDYARGGHAVLAVVDPTGVRTAWTAMVWAVAMVPVSLAPVMAMPGRIGLVYVVIATAAGVGFVWSAVRFARTLAERDARALFLGSIAYLPVVLVALVCDAAVTRLL